MSAKELLVRPIAGRSADQFIRRVHYSGRVVQNSQIHLGVFWKGLLEGVIQLGPSMDKRKVQSLVRGTRWDGFIEINRLAFSEALPRNSESRALAVALRLLRQRYRQLEWVVSFADATQCGDGTIYRAAGFLLCGITKNTTIWVNEDGDAGANIGLRMRSANKLSQTKGAHATAARGSAGMQRFRDAGFAPAKGFQLRYIRFLDPKARARLAVEVLPYSAIRRAGATMYRGQPRAVEVGDGPSEDTATVQRRSGRSTS